MNLKHRFLVMDMLFEGGRMFVGGISIAFLISRGILVADIAMIKALQAFIVFAAEVPTGVIGDRYGHKFSLFAAVISALIGFTFYLSSNHLISFLVGEFFLALSLCFWSGSYEAWASTDTGIDQCADQTKSFFHLNMSINQTAIVILGFAGGYISGINNYQNAYWGALIIMTLLLVVIIFTPKIEKQSQRASNDLANNTTQTPETSSMHIFKTAVQYSFNNSKLREILLISIALQFLAQPLLHYWQPLFLSIKTDLSGQGLGLIFSMYSGAIVLASYIFKKKNNISNGLLLLVWICLYIVIGQINNFYTILAVFCFQQMAYSVLKVRYGSALAHSAPAHIRASIISVNSLVARVGMLASLFFLSQILKNSAVSYQNLYAALGGVSLGLFVLVKVAKMLKASVKLPKSHFIVF